MKIGDQVEGGIYAGTINGHHIIYSPIEYELPFQVNWHQAVEYCNSIGMELPSKYELILLYNLHKSNPEYFHKQKYNWYWTSTEFSATSARIHAFSNGSQYAFDKTNNYHARAVRRIKI